MDRCEGLACQGHQCGHESLHRLAKIVAIKTWTSQGERSLVIVFGIRLFQIGADGIQIGDSLCLSDSGLEMSHGHKNPAFAARVELVRPLDLLLVDDGSKETGIEKHESSAEARRRHTDDGVGMLVHLSNAADDAAVILKMSMPIVVAKNDVRSAVGAMLIGGMEETAEVRVNAQHIEVASAD